MHCLRHYLLAICTVALFCGSAAAQDKKTVTGNFIAVPFNQFVQEAETQTGCRFYYDSTQTDSLKITHRADGETLDELLNAVLKNTGLRFSIDDNSRIFITKQVEIYTSLPPNFFGNKKAKDATGFVVSEQTDIEKESSGNKLKSSLENKLFEIGTKTNSLSQGDAVITGYVRDAKSG